MAVPGGRNGLQDDEEEAEGLFEDEVAAWANPENDTPPHLRALLDAVQRGDSDALRLALGNHNVGIDDPVEDGDTILHLSCLYGHLPCVQLLVERGANLESKDEEGAIPLHDACAGGFAGIVQYVVDAAAANPDLVKRMLNTVDTERDTPLHHAARGEHLDVVNLLLAVGASPTCTNIDGKTPAELADPGTEVRSILEAAAAAASGACK